MNLRYTVLMMPAFLIGCASLPSLDGRTESRYLDTPSSPRLEASLKLAHKKQPADSDADTSDVYLLNDAHDAFVARAELIDAADHTLDIQYYIWHNDISGKLLFNLVHRAAERGVRCCWTTTTPTASTTFYWRSTAILISKYACSIPSSRADGARWAI